MWLLVLLVLLVPPGSSCCPLPPLPPRFSFLLNSTDRPLVHFSPAGVHNTTTLLLSDDGSTLYVGARDAVLSLDVSQRDVISLKRKTDWSPAPSETDACKTKGKDETVDCPNFVQVLLSINSTHLYVCGSFAYNPHDAYMDAQSLSLVRTASKPNTEARGRCPFSPLQRNTAITVDGELFTGTTSDFRGLKPIIARHISKDGRPDVSQDTSISLLEDPEFVSSSFDPAEGKLYFFFSEVAKEYSFTEELRVARVAQVCKDDVGGQRTLQKRWTSFAKAPLLCQPPKQPPLTLLQDVFTLQPPGGTDTLFYGIFTSQWLMDSRSAVCVYKLQDVRSVFGGSYRTFDMQMHQLSPLQDRHSYLGKCGLGNATDAVLAEVKRSFLTSGSVKPVGGVPVFSTGQRYSRIAAMRTNTTDGKEHTVLFLLTESGFLHKVLLLAQGPRLLEEVQVFTQPQLLKTIVLSAAKGVVYVGTSEGVTAVPVASCQSHRTCSRCVMAGDPFCAWDLNRRLCSSVTPGATNMVQDVENSHISQECLEQTKVQNLSVEVHLNEVVRLSCSKPSNLATLKWTFPGERAEQLSVQSADGGLMFLAAPDTLGTFRCTSKEGGHEEDVVIYTVRQRALPRSPALPPTVKQYNTDTSDHRETATNPPEITENEEWVPLTMEPSRNLEENPPENPGHVSDDGENKVSPTQGATESDYGYRSDDPTTAGAETSGSDQQLEDVPDIKCLKEKSYFSELLVVSLLLAVCVSLLMLTGFFRWRQRKAGLKTSPLVTAEEAGEAQDSLESVPSLSPDSSTPELKVVE
ncbi:semaphorin-4A-like [Myripristis murdjan]|uniref:semaphorin-4A-like n=1 Tax=Myripristis murdjan TaxID=586833 RepID=UPI001175D8EE|nr:semaphorin-4A-like [Myripristis murdjan]